MGFLADDPGQWQTPEDLIRKRRLDREGIEAFRKQDKEDRERLDQIARDLMGQKGAHEKEEEIDIVFLF